MVFTVDPKSQEGMDKLTELMERFINRWKPNHPRVFSCIVNNDRTEARIEFDPSDGIKMNKMLVSYGFEVIM